MRRLPASDPPRPKWWTQVILVVGFAWAYDEVRSLHGNVIGEAVRHGRAVHHLDVLIHADWSPSLNAWLGHHTPVADILAVYYVVMHLGVTSLVLLLLWLQGPHYRYHRNVLIFLSVIGFAVYWVYPTAPPRLSGFGIRDTVAHALPFAYSVESKSANLYAAIPSLHLAWAVWAAIAVWAMTSNRWWRTLAVLHPIATAVTVLGTGNHYTVDVLSGVALTAVSYPLYDLVTRAVGSAFVRRKGAAQRLDRRGAGAGGLVAGDPADGGGDLVGRSDHGLADRR